MKHTFIYFLVLIAASCGQSSQPADTADGNARVSGNDSTRFFSISEATAVAYGNAVKVYKEKLQDTSVIKKKNGVIQIPLESPEYPPYVVFHDTLTDADGVSGIEYNYLGQFKESGIVLVSAKFWEHFECYLIDKETGKRVSTWNVPKQSPSAEYFANISMPYGIGGTANGLQIWKINNNEIELINKILELDQQLWAPQDFIWDSDNTLLLKVFPVNKFRSGNKPLGDNDFYYLRVAF